MSTGLALKAAVLVALCAASASAAPTAAQGRARTTAQAPGACTPYALPPPFTSVEELCASWGQKPTSYFDELFRAARPPAPTDAFPHVGCTYGCVPGAGFIPRFARSFFATTSAGWSGKCIQPELDPVTNLPTLLLNMISPTYYNASLPVEQRLQAELTIPGIISLNATSAVDGRPAYVFDYSQAPELTASYAGGESWRAGTMSLPMGAIKDEMRVLAPGIMIGQMMGVVDGSATVLTPFLLFQSCAADGGVAMQPTERALPLLVAPSATSAPGH